MLRELTAEEIKAQEERVRYLYTTDWVQDNITASLMDTRKGGSGLGEAVARAKAHDILDLFAFLEQQKKREKPKLAVGVSVLLVRDGKLLLGERKNASAAGLFSTPGGRIELDEDRFECAIRETREETGIELDHEKITFLGFREHFRFGNHYIMLYALCSEFKGEPENFEPDKCKGWEWFLFRDIPEKCTEPTDILLQVEGFI